MDTNRIIIGPDIDFGDFPWFVGIYLLIEENSGKLGRVFRENPIGLFSGCSIRVNQFMSGNFLKVSDLLLISLPPSHTPLPFKIKFMKSDR